MKIPDKPPDFMETFKNSFDDDKDLLFKIISSAIPTDAKGRYLHWDKLKY